jgi:SAM-dependent methyltransferase
MRTVVLDLDVFEEDVKPQELLAEYRRLLEADMTEVVGGGLVTNSCPGCRSDQAEEAFTRFGMVYHRCRACQSLYVSPRPCEETLATFYREAPSAVFWRQQLLPATMETRVAKLFRPRAQWLLDVVDEYRPESRNAVAVGYHNDLLIEQLVQQESQLFDIVVTNSIADIEFADKDIPGVTLQPLAVAELDQLQPADLFLAFDILDRCVDPDLLFAQAAKVVAPGGLLLATTTLGSGFDIQVLWERADGVYPPERLNLLSVEGLTELFERHGFEALEFSTPGMFDVDSVRHEMDLNPEGELPRFIRYLIEHRGEDAWEALQEYLQRFRLSSFGRVALRKTV